MKIDGSFLSFFCVILFFVVFCDRATSQTTLFCQNGNIPLIANGSISNSINATTSPVGTQLNVQCDKTGGYVMRGSGIIECTKNQTWQIGGFCEKANECEAAAMSASPKKRSYYDDGGDDYSHRRSRRKKQQRFHHSNNQGCGDIPEIDNGLIEAVFWTRNGGAVGKLMCHPSYVLNGFSEVVCKPNGEWLIRGDCDEPYDDIQQHNYDDRCDWVPKVKHGSITMRNYARGELKCRPNYRRVGSSYAVCNPETGVWTVFGECRRHPMAGPPLSCKNVKEVKHGYIAVSIHSQPGKTEGKLRCDNDYRIKGQETAECDHETGKWRIDGKCQHRDEDFDEALPQIGCGPVPRVQHGSITEISRKTFKSIEYLTCEAGYVLNGNNVVTCQHNGQWKVIGVCLRGSRGDTISPPFYQSYTPRRTTTFSSSSSFYGRCGKVPVVNNGRITQTDSEVETLICNPGYVVEGSKNVACSKHDLWLLRGWCRFVSTQPTTTSEKPTTTKPSGNCLKPPPVPNGFITTNTKRTVNDVEWLICRENYTLVGPNSVTCKPNLTWSLSGSCILQNHSCVSTTPEPDALKRCGPPPTVANGFITTNSQRYIGSIELLICCLGCSLVGRRGVLCGRDRVWQVVGSCQNISSTPPSPVNCPPFQVIDHGYVSQGNVTCVSPYIKTNHLTATCDNQQGKWVADGMCQLPDNVTATTLRQTTLPTVTMTTAETAVKCKSVPTVPNGSITTQTNGDVGDIELLSCDQGFKLVPSSAEEVECSADGTWAVKGSCKPGANRCTVTPQLQNGVAVAYSTNEGDVANLTCNRGFVMVGDNVALCNDQGSWEYRASCVSTCSNITKFNGGTIMITVPGDIVNKQPTTGQLICPDGWLLNGIKDLKCDENGWDISQSYCEPVEKNCTTNVNDTIINGYGFDTNGWVSAGIFECNPGFNLTGDNNYECTPDGRWYLHGACVSPLNAGCPKQRSSVIFGQVTTTNNILKQIGESETLVCDPGYDLVGTDTVVCNSTRQWDVVGYCNWPVWTLPEVNKSQSNLPIINNYCNTVPSVDRANVYLGMVDGWRFYMIQCIPPYTLVGDATIVCVPKLGPNKEVIGNQWQPSGECQLRSRSAVVTYSPRCIIVPLLENGLIITPGTMDTVGTIAAVICNSGYILQGSNEAVCAENGQWIVDAYCIPFPKAKRGDTSDCGQLPETANGIVKSNEINQAVLTCNPDFELKGSANYECYKGKWQVRGVCISVSESAKNTQNCSGIPLPQVKNGVVTRSGSNIATLSCDNGYTVRTSNIVECNTLSQWRVLGFCERNEINETTCPKERPQIPNAQITVESPILTVGATEKLVCSPEFAVLGSNKVHCTSYGVWQVDGTCIRHCQTDSTIPNGSIKHFNNSILFGGITCNSGFVPVSGGSIIAKCDTYKGKWNTSTTCVAPGDALNVCDKLPSQPNGVLLAKARTAGLAVASIKCNEGFVIDGPDTVQCTLNKWQITGQCKKLLDCPQQLPAIKNGGIYVPPNSSFQIGATRDLRCQPGYFARGSKIIRCTSQSKWQIGGFCTLRDCISDPPTVENGEVVDLCLPVVAGSRLTIKCDDGYTFNTTESVVTCQGNDNWQLSGACIPAQVKGRGGEIEETAEEKETANR